MKNVTGFPTGINAASTFSRRLMRQRGVAIGEEFRGKGAQLVQTCLLWKSLARSEWVVDLSFLIAQRFLGTRDGHRALFLSFLDVFMLDFTISICGGR